MAFVCLLYAVTFSFYSTVCVLFVTMFAGSGCKLVVRVIFSPSVVRFTVHRFTAPGKHVRGKMARAPRGKGRRPQVYPSWFAQKVVTKWYWDGLMPNEVAIELVIHVNTVRRIIRSFKMGLPIALQGRAKVSVTSTSRCRFA